MFLLTYTFWPMRQQGRAVKGTLGAGIQAELVVRRLHCTLPFAATVLAANPEFGDNMRKKNRNIYYPSRFFNFPKLKILM